MRHHFLVTRFKERITAVQTLLLQWIEVWNKAGYRHFSHPLLECLPFIMIPAPPFQIGLMPWCIDHRDQCFPLTAQIQNQFEGRLQNDLAYNITILGGFVLGGLKHLNMIEACGMKWAQLREMIVDVFITISLCIKWLNLPQEIFPDSFCSARINVNVTK